MDSPLPDSAQNRLEEEVFSFDLRRYLEALRRYGLALIALIALAVTGAVIYTKRQPYVYEAQASVQIEPRLPELLGQGENALLSGTAAASTDYYKQQKQVLGSYTLVRETVKNHQLALKLLNEIERAGMKPEDQIDAATHRLRKKLQVKYPDQDRIMYVVVRGEDPHLAADIANFHVATYVAYSRNLLTAGSSQASEALQSEFETVAKKLQENETALYQFRKDNDLLTISLEDRQSLMSANITSYTSRMNDARAKRIELAAKLDRMKKASELDVLESPILMMSDSPSFDTLRAQYYAERNQFLQIEKDLGPKNPDYQKQKAKVEDLHDALRAEAKRIIGGVEEQYQTMVATEKALGAEVDRYKKEAFELGDKILQSTELQRTKKNFEDRYDILRHRLSTSEMTGRMNTRIETSNVKPLDPALVPTQPVSPSLRVNVTVGGALSAILGIGIIFLIVFLDRTVKSADDAQQAGSAPVLGVIPIIDTAELPDDDDRARDLYVHEHPTSRVAECCRSMRTNVLFAASGASRDLKTIVVSSANPREGKTTSVIYLGTTMAQSGQRVLLIDTDMRRPRLHSSTGIPHSRGLSNLLLGDENYDDVIKATDIPNLFVLPCGPMPPNPAELLMTERFVEILRNLESRFDRIVLDSPPLQAVTDAVVLSKNADGVIIVARAGMTQRDEVRRSTKQIRDVNGRIVGIVLNEFDASNHRGGYYYYARYGYEYRATKSDSAA